MVLASLVAISLAYAFPAGSKSYYDFTATMEGYVPLLGRPQSNVEIKLAIEVVGKGAATDGNFGVTCDIVDMKASLSGVALPFTVDNIKAFFPMATLSVSPSGKVLKTDVPDLQLPVRLPGLDPKRIPDITFLPIELPEGAIEIGMTWTFRRNFGGSDAAYTATAVSFNESYVTFDLKLTQNMALFEDAAGNEVKLESDAFNKIETIFTGSGRVVFDRKRSVAKSFIADSEAVSQVTQLKSGEKSERRVKSKLKSELRVSAS